jgi:hypothetical protein
MNEIREYLISLGWKPFRDGFIDKGSERYLDLSGDYGFVWDLHRFTDGDINGVAVGRFESYCEGDTLAELQEVLN